ncbi:putative nuclease of the RecB family [Terriglobus roseus DSM 18391]|uniref:Putative nuclease of the RecB family n=1 Tax=Terriglobus roseus (strain DSM 18391 / NRRL B-41598 / KBS 63) TaxID=926566 RepID=I3ZMT3_TERRK|nr:endonuclease NucS domain-containing protein [Terriglobus roseus]AFL90551.1 putative nuclease of the RecB family [Terriglobus roseus DSM 18391]
MIQVYAIEDGELKDLPHSKLKKEDDLQRWIANDPSVLGLDILVLGREISTDFRGRIDVLGLDAEGNLVVVECKRDQTPRETIAQLLDYGSWVAALSTKQVHELAITKLGRPLAQAFMERFDSDLPEKLNTTHSLIVVATEFDASSRRIVEYLAQVHQLSINAIFFSSFNHAGQDLLAIEWLLDQEEVVQRAESKTSAPWTGLNYVNIGESKDRNWDDMREYGFISAGGGPRYVGSLQKLAPGDLVLSYQKKTGYVGFGSVLDTAVPVDQFTVAGRPILESPLRATDFGHDVGDASMCEFVVRVKWIKTFGLSEAKTFPGVFANQNIVCKLTHPATIEFLKSYFPISASD